MVKLMFNGGHLRAVWRLVWKEAGLEAESPVKTVIKVTDSEAWCLGGYRGKG